MGTKRYSQRPSFQKNGKSFQSLPFAGTEQFDEKDEGGLAIGQLLGAVRRRLPMIAFITVTVTALALIQSLNSNRTKVYEAKFELLIQPITAENKLVSSLSESLSSKQSISTITEINKTDLRILQSPKLVDPIIEKVKKKYPQSDNTLNLKLNPIQGTSILEVSYQDRDPEKIKYVLNLVSESYLKYSLEERRVDIQQGIRFVDEQLPQLKWKVATLENELQAFRQNYNLIDPTGQGKQISSTLDKVINQRLESRTELAKTTALYNTLQSQLNLQPNEAAAAAALSESPRYQDLLNKVKEVETKIALESTRYSEESPVIAALREQRSNLLPLVRQEAQNILTPEVYNAVQNTQGLTSPSGLRGLQIQQFFEAAKQIQSLKAQDEALAQVENDLRVQFKEFPRLIKQNNDLERNLKIASDNLNQFLNKQEALKIDNAQKQVPWQLLTPPTEPDASSSVKTKQNLILGAVLGLLLGIGSALLIDKLRNVLYTTREVRNKTKFLILGEIPARQTPKKLTGTTKITKLLQGFDQNFKLIKPNKLRQKDNSFQFWESFRSLYANIRFLSFDDQIRSIAIVSTDANDGSSMVALHLAQTAAAMGQRVLLVDANLRYPKIHTMLGLPNIKGLSNAIVEDLDFNYLIYNNSRNIFETSSVNRVNEALPKQIVEFQEENDFFVLTAGQIPLNPAKLLSSNKVQELVKRFETAFDLVIYDTSPLFDTSDGNLLAAHMDASLLIVGLGTTNSSMLETVIEKVKISGNPILGVVANGASLASS